MFEVGGWDSSSKTITFGKGSFQGTRGDGYGGDWFVENVFEELGRTDCKVYYK
jgi:hypothetical protein